MLSTSPSFHPHATPRNRPHLTLSSSPHPLPPHNSINNAWVAHGRGWTLEADDNPVVKLAGPALDFHLNWRDEVVFADGERFGYRKPKSVLGGIVVGTMHLTHTVREREREGRMWGEREREGWRKRGPSSLTSAPSP